MDFLQTARPATLRRHLETLGNELRQALKEVICSLPEEAWRTGGLSELTGVNKVFASRLLKGMRQKNPLAVLHRLPGPEPMLRFLKGLSADQVPPAARTRALQQVQAFQLLIAQEAGSRSALQTMMTPWLSEGQEEFAMRRRQTTFKAMSELRGASVELNLSTAILHPSAAAGAIDLVWVMGLFGVKRLQEGTQVRLDTCLLSDEGHARRPTTFLNEELEAFLPGGIETYCPNGPAQVETRQVNETMNYLLGGQDFGPRSLRDMLLVEVNREELRRFRPEEPQRRSYIYANPTPPARQLALDLLIHKSLLEEEPPELLVYDTAGFGPRDPNDALSEFDRLQISEPLTYHDAAFGLMPLAAYPPYAGLMANVLDHLVWDQGEFHQWRVQMDYPLYSSQVTLAFRTKP